MELSQESSALALLPILFFGHSLSQPVVGVATADVDDILGDFDHLRRELITRAARDSEGDGHIRALAFLLCPTLPFFGQGGLNEKNSLWPFAHSTDMFSLVSLEPGL